MGLSDSVWRPDSLKDASVIGLIVIMTLLHHTELLGLMNAGLVFDWLPLQFVYDIAYSILAIVLLCWIYVIAPKEPEEVHQNRIADNSSTSESSALEEI